MCQKNNGEGGGEEEQGGGECEWEGPPGNFTRESQAHSLIASRERDDC